MSVSAEGSSSVFSKLLAALFVIWCSTADRIYWSAGHVAFMPQYAWFMFDLFNYTGQHDHFDDDEAEGSGEI